MVVRVSFLVAMAAVVLDIATSVVLSLCGDYPAPLNSTAKKNVMLIGDSISMPVPFSPGGYGLNVKGALSAMDVSTWHAGGWASGGQASNTAKGLKCTNSSTDGNYLNFTGQYDVIHFNWGLHDLDDREFVDLDTYAGNLEVLFARLAPRAKQMIWASSTPCPNVTTSMGRTDQRVRDYNAAALAALKAAAAEVGTKLVVDDLYSAVVGYCGKNYKECDLQKPANVHFTAKGCAFLGDHVVKSLMPYLQ